MIADSVVFESEEDGWHMIVVTDDGASHDFHVHDIAWDLVEHLDRTLGDWRREGEAARAVMPDHGVESDGQASAPAGGANTERG